jgi:hypothetical protein
MRRPTTVPMLAALAALSPATLACDYCLMSQGLSPLDTVSGRGLRVTQRYVSLDTVYEGEHERPNPGAEETYYTTEFTGFWTPLPRLTVVGILPLRVTRVDGHLAHHGHGDEGDAGAADDHAEPADHLHAVDPQTGGDEGFGDLALMARWKAFEHHTLESTTTLAVQAGVKLPSGSTDGRADNGEYLDAHLQLGTGATDGLFGVAANHTQGRWAVSANLLASVKGDGEAGGVDYDYGDALNYDLTVRYRVSPSQLGGSPHQTFLALGVAGEAWEKEREAGVELDDSGGHVLFIQPGLQHNWGARLVLEVAAQVPVHHSLNGTQLGDDLKVFGSATWMF